MGMGLFFGILALLLAIGMPVAGVFGSMALFPSMVDASFAYNAAAVVRSMFSGLDSFTLLAVPLFMVSGMIMAKGGLSERLFNFFAYFIGNKTAGFPCAVVVTCMFYAAISGSAPATVSAVGAMTIPFLVSMGYEKIFAAAIVTVAGGLGVIIPPSISYIVYSSATGASPSNLFIAGIIPGILIGFALMLYCWIYCKRHGEDKALLMEHYNSIRSKGFGQVFKESFWALLTPIIILGSIYGGIASPTEAAVISVVYGLFVCIFIYKTIPVTGLGNVFTEGAKTYVNILFVIAAATAFARCLTMLRYPQMISSAVLESVDNRIVILLIMNLIMLVCGMIIDNIPNIMILTPILLPIATAVGVDPIHFGIVMTVNLAIGMVTPPMGINLFVASGMTKIPMFKLARATVPFLAAFAISLAAITYIPQLSLALPSLATGEKLGAVAEQTGENTPGSDGAEEPVQVVEIDGEYQWNAAMSVSDTTINYKIVDKFAQLINARSGGKIDVTLYPGGQMGNTTEFTQAVIAGTIDIGTGMTTDLVDFVPQSAIFDLPNLFPDLRTMRNVLKGSFVDTMNEYNKAGGVMMLGYGDAGFRELTSNKPVHQLEDLKGQNIRVMTNPYHIAYWNALGANAVSMEFTEVFMGLQQGTIDGEENPYMNIVGNNFQEVQDYIIETNHIGHIITFFMNNDLYESLPDNVRELVDECAADAIKYGNEMADESIASYKQTCVDAGCEIITLDQSVLDQLKEKADVVYNMVRENLGDELVDQALKAVEAARTAAAAGNVTITPVEVKDNYQWTAAMSVSDTTINYKIVEKFAQLLDENSGGKIKIDIYPGGQMGNTTEFTQAVIAGTIDIGTGMTTDLVDFVPQSAIFDLPNLFPDLRTMRNVLKGSFVDTMNEYNKAGGVMMLGYGDAGFRELTSNKPVHQLEDLKGQNIRVMTNPYHIAYWNALGANAVSMEFTEVFMGLQQGTIDGEENPYMNIVGNNFQEVQDYIIETNHIGHIITFFMNNDLYESLPDNVRELVDECAADAIKYGNEMADESIASYKQTCVDAGCEIITLDQSVLDQLKEKADVVYNMVRENLGDELVDEAMEAVNAAQY
ncbi:MAG: TRAP transporter substrate-binding protein DctP [Eubacteriales bacterium]|nr:TRAP transporter substrate-binding protein DctP [Eubacteriales bacterium]